MIYMHISGKLMLRLSPKCVVYLGNVNFMLQQHLIDLSLRSIKHPLLDAIEQPLDRKVCICFL